MTYPIFFAIRCWPCAMIERIMGEERWICIGWIKRLMGVVVYTERCGDVIRIISARKATKKEAKYYDANIQN